ncbi:hypothetical protein [Flagellimonas pacifica]|uniref:Outer membrane protein W n=1 Tax=Flagellimonas pacifica TaxID=1247520 RepID=A0A285MVQ7_9FLAO|nr:hypothetical protein [Allomuricauda parva]SNZ01198.1 Outer membrane protein W [Allomuricauda parva]
MKKIFLAIVVMASMTQFLSAQEQNKFRVGLDLGYAIPDGGGGILIALEPKYNIADNMNVGIRIESAAMAKKVGLVEASLAGSTSYSGTFDYYFSSGSSSFAPFIGAGVGYSSLANVGFDIDIDSGFGDDSPLTIDEELELEVDGSFGGLVRAGFEAGKLRLAATYNLIGKSDLGEGAEIKNSYIGISLGFYVGGGKWKN